MPESDEEEEEGVEGRQWAAGVLESVLGSDAKVYAGVGDWEGMECFERALVGKKGWEGGEDVGLVAAQMKANLHQMCR